MQLANAVRNSSLRFRILAGLWLLFALLVAFKIHGSSIDRAALFWRPEGHGPDSSDYLFEPVVNLARKALGDRKFEVPHLPELYGQISRTDEYKVGTPYAIAQCVHVPACPVINTNIGYGQNMLPIHCGPVWHPASICRPATWGYLFFGAERGLAWYWWFQPFACFSAVFLLLEILLKGRLPLAAFGAFWCVGSAYMVCWSNVPAYFTFFPAAGCVAGYRLLQAPSLRVQAFSAVALGLLVPGFVMLLYPPWQVALGYLFLILFAGLSLRDKLFRNALEIKRAAFIVLALLLMAAFLASFFSAALPALKTLSATVYPGNRSFNGGEVPFWQLCRGWYNFWSTHQVFDSYQNVCEAASFYHLYPVIALAAILSPRLRRGLSYPGWGMLVLIGILLVFMNRGFPEWLAHWSVMDYVLPKRADVAVGVASILLSVQTLAVMSAPEEFGKAASRVPLFAGVAMALLLGFAGLITVKFTNYEISPYIVFTVLLGGGYLAYCLIAGKTEPFCAGVMLLVVGTSGLFNPLSSGLGAVFDSEMAREVSVVESKNADKSFWLCYGEQHPGVFATMLNCRSLSGVHYYPQLALWHQLDPARRFEPIYNRYAHVGFLLNLKNPDPAAVEFTAPEGDILLVRLSPLNPSLKKIGARYVLVYGSEQKNFEALSLKLLHKGRNGMFAIYEIP